jgi:hypothetical protein
MAEHLSAPRFADQVVMLQDAAVCLELRAFLQGDDEMFVTQADQLSEIAMTGNR